MASLRAYGKVNEANDQAERLQACRKTRKRITIITLSSVVLIVVIVAAIVGTNVGKSKNGGGGDSGTQSGITTSIKAACALTLYPESCSTSLAPFTNSSQQIDPLQLVELSILVAMNEVFRASQYFSSERGGSFDSVTDKMSIAALKSCGELLGLALDHLNYSTTTSSSTTTLVDAIDDLKTWLSAAGTYQQTCIDGFENVTGNLKTSVYGYLKNSTEFTSNSLAIISQIINFASGSLKQRRLMSLSSDVGDMPHWLSVKDRRLLQSRKSKIRADIIVAKDGSGKYKTIGDALKDVPDKSEKRFVIYVKKGLYYENVRVEKPKWNVMMIGDGMHATIVSSSLNFVDGTPTFSTATFAAFGKGFIARDMGFRSNTAGAIKHQAVALMSTSDQSVFHRCHIDAFQDTLYAHSNRQFYCECNIYGTVDFIFGNSAVVLQNCTILPKKPMHGQQNTITAQGRIDPNQNTGISMQNCYIWPGGNLTSVSTFLGRPWKNYSTTVYMQSTMGSLIDPKGWLPWSGDTAPDTIFYAEFLNSGPGSSTKNRVNWKGLRNIDKKHATKFTVKSFIKGEKWISAAGVSYKPGL